MMIRLRIEGKPQWMPKLHFGGGVAHLDICLTFRFGEIRSRGNLDTVPKSRLGSQLEKNSIFFSFLISPR